MGPASAHLAPLHFFAPQFLRPFFLRTPRARPRIFEH